MINISGIIIYTFSRVVYWISIFIFQNTQSMHPLMPPTPSTYMLVWERVLQLIFMQITCPYFIVPCYLLEYVSVVNGGHNMLVYKTFCLLAVSFLFASVSTQCPNKCSTRGDCVAHSNTCSCYPGHIFADCSGSKFI